MEPYDSGQFFHDLTATSIVVNKGNHPKMTASFRVVNYYNLPRYWKHDSKEPLDYHH